MDRNKVQLRWLSIILLLVVQWPVRIRAQLGPLSSREQAPQARSQDELDQYLVIVTETNPRDLLHDVDAFIQQYPNSELAGTAYQLQMHAYEQTGDFEGMLAAGQKALGANPDNLNTLLTLAPAIANYGSRHPDRTDLLTLADEYAHRALQGIDKVRPPRQMPLARWETEERDLQSQAHEVLGVTALIRKNAVVAINEFQLSLQLATTAQGSQYMRLASAFASAGNKVEAKKSLQRAAELGPEPVRQLALEQIKELSSTLSKPARP